MGGGRDFATGTSIYIRRGGVYYRRDGSPVNYRKKEEEPETETGSKNNQNVPASLKNFTGNTERAKRLYDSLSPEEREAVDAGMKAIQAYIDKSDMRIRVTKRAMLGILSSGEVWNQMQSGTSRGAYDPEERRRLSKKMFGHDGDLEDAEYEKYGYLSDGQTDAADWYGDFDIILKKNEMLPRTTMSLGDTLDYSVDYPSFLSNPQFISSGEGMRTDAYRFQRRAEHLLRTGKYYDSGDGYAELQFHGSVTLADIDHISMPRGWKDNPPSYQRETIRALEDAGFKITYDAHD